MSTLFVPYTLTLQAPAVLTGLDGNPDSARTLEHVPGSVVRGAIARALGDPGNDPQRLARFRELVLSGRVRYLDAYPVADGRRSLPTPVSWRREKYGETVHDLAAGEPETAEPVVSLGAPFVTLGAADCREVPVALSAAIHHRRSRVKGRPVENEGALFVYESLDAGQVFRGFLVVEGENEAEATGRADAVRQAAGETLLLGRSRRAGYGGQALLAWGPPRERELEGRSGLVDRDLAAGDTFRLLAVSDLIVRDPHTAALDPAAIETVIETGDGSLSGRAELIRGHWQLRPVGGFNRKWGLELPQALALRAGSVLALRAREPIALGDLLAVERAGLGERRAEGFGRVAFFEAPDPQPVVLPPAAETPVEKPSKVPATVRRMERRLLEDALEARVLEVAAERLRGGPGPTRLPSPSLLARLRGPLRAGPEGLDALGTWLGGADDALRSKARQALDGARIVGWDGKRAPLRDWLQEALTMVDASLGERLGFERLAERHHLVSRESALDTLLGEDQVRRTRWRLIDQVLALAALEAKRSKETAQETGQLTGQVKGEGEGAHGG